MLGNELLVVHAVQVVTRENQVLLSVGLVEQPQVLTHGISGTLEPLGVGGALLGREHLNEALVLVATHVGVVRLGQVTVEGSRVELGQAVNLVHVGVDTVRHGNVNQAVVSAEGHRGLRAHLGEGVQAGTRATTQNDAEHGLLDGGRQANLLLEGSQGHGGALGGLGASATGHGGGELGTAQGIAGGNALGGVLSEDALLDGGRHPDF
mmetsp:Transcript_26876/g.58607  ORF Transcript_26876/g.58607 Transcript_26876/m.58607 type:complete len:208 (-) Transcript_26876:59-682(-)